MAGMAQERPESSCWRRSSAADRSVPPWHARRRRAGLDVRLWAREPEVVEAINAGDGNPVFLKGIPVEPGIRASLDLAQTARAADMVLLAVPSQFLRGIAEQLRPVLAPQVPVVSCSKGIERGTCALMPEVIADALPQATIAVLAGPSFAREVALGLPTGVTLACAEPRRSGTAGRGSQQRPLPRLYFGRSDQRDHRRRLQERAGHRLRHRDGDATWARTSARC